MDKETLNNVLTDLGILKETIFLIWLKLEKDKNLSIGEKMYLERRIKIVLQKLMETEYRIFKVTIQEKEPKEDIYVLSDRGVIVSHDLIDALESIIEVDTLWDIHDDIVEITDEMEKKGIK